MPSYRVLRGYTTDETFNDYFYTLTISIRFFGGGYESTQKKKGENFAKWAWKFDF